MFLQQLIRGCFPRGGLLSHHLGVAPGPVPQPRPRPQLSTKHRGRPAQPGGSLPGAIHPSYSSLNIWNITPRETEKR